MVLLQIQSHTASVSRKSLFLCSPDLILSTLGLLRFCSRNDCRAILPEHSNICKHCSAACPIPSCTICRFPVKGNLLLFFCSYLFWLFSQVFRALVWGAHMWLIFHAGILWMLLFLYALPAVDASVRDPMVLLRVLLQGLVRHLLSRPCSPYLLKFND